MVNKPKIKADKKNKIIVIAVILLAAFANIGLVLYFILGGAQLTPNPAHVKAQPVIDLINHLGGKKICEHGFNGVGGIDSNTPTYYAIFDVPNSDDLADQVISSSVKTGYQVRQLGQTSAFEVSGTMHITTNDPNSNSFDYYSSTAPDSPEYFSNQTDDEIANSTLSDEFNIAIIHGTAVASSWCGDKNLVPSSANNVIVALDVTLWGK